MKNDIEESEKDFGTIPILDVDLSNETAFLVFSIIASIFTVSNLFKNVDTLLSKNKHHRGYLFIFLSTIFIAINCGRHTELQC